MNKRTKRLLAMMSAKPKLRTVSGLPPLSYKAKKAGTLSNYRIYGNTVSGESVGDRTGNLFDKNAITIGYAILGDGVLEQNENFCISNFIDVSDKTFCKVYNLIKGGTLWTFRVHGYNSSKDWLSQLYEYMPDANTPISSNSINIPSNVKYIRMSIGYVNRQNLDILMFSTNTNLNDYEPYGYRVAVTAGGVNIFDENYEGLNTLTHYRPLYVGDGTFTLSTNAPKNSANTTNLYLIAGAVSTGASYVNNGVSLNSPHTVTSVDGYVTVAYRISGGINPSDYHAMLNKGSSALPYEPYSEPVTTNIYLPEQISKVGNVTEYIDYREQKQYFADGTSADVTLPALSLHKGTNILSAGTEVRPSSVEIKGRIKSIS